MFPENPPVPEPEPGVPAVTEPEAAVTEPAPAPEPEPAAPAAPEPSGRAGELEAELAKIRSEAIAGLKAILRVLPPHSSMTYGGITVTDQPTEVPAHAVAGLSEAAANAGVKLIQEA